MRSSPPIAQQNRRGDHGDAIDGTDPDYQENLLIHCVLWADGVARRVAEGVFSIVGGKVVSHFDGREGGWWRGTEVGFVE